MAMKNPEDCASIHDIRNEIDAIDEQVIEMIGKRLQYVKGIVRFKKDEEDILARKRYGEVLVARREWAVKQGIDPDVIESMYKSLIAYFIKVQKKELKLEKDAKHEIHAAR